MAQAKTGDTVKVHYTGKFEDDTVFDTSTDREPLEFTIGKGQMIPGFEEAVLGMNLDESKNVQIPADKAYGPHREDRVMVVDRSQLPENLEPKVGQQLQVNQEDGKGFVVTVTDVSESSVTLDGNHPLAGKDLIFNIQLVEVV